ncbi:MAG TPA: imidazole glycerol phosphate synthase subunit HisH [Anaerolineaceae bacterium]|nr:imidazole glycerol phosphate synthase subunit HisH [Anaerolineaceae bacterium]
MSQVLLVDAGTGNLHSVHHALLHLGCQVMLTADPELVRRGGRILLPGVGAFGAFMDGLRQRGLDLALQEAIQRGNPLLGICVGMQALLETGEEMGERPGLGILPGRVTRFPERPGLKIPHTGWNQFWPQAPSPLFAGMPDGPYAYFNHSYYCALAHPQDAIACTGYGIQFASVLQRENVCGIQFHPEKSQKIGLRLLANFIGEAELP